MAYTLAIEWGIQPSEFWNMSIAEWWWVFDSKYVKVRRETEGNYTTRDEWDELHRRHKEKFG